MTCSSHALVVLVQFFGGDGAIGGTQMGWDGQGGDLTETQKRILHSLKISRRRGLDELITQAGPGPP
eukprot:scaffold5859_cov28-Attheya_sp.AAC.1